MRYIILNWKAYLKPAHELLLCQKIIDFLTSKAQSAAAKDTHIVLLPSYISIATIVDMCSHIECVSVGAQACSEFQPGAFTGEITADKLEDIGCRYVLVGHFERRKYFPEENLILQAENIRKAGMMPILCVGNKNAQPVEKTLEDVYEQLADFSEIDDYMIAYEPRWAIGSGATPEISEIKRIMSTLKKVYNKLIVYGGSVSAKNIENFQHCLIGHAATQWDALQQALEKAGYK